MPNTFVWVDIPVSNLDRAIAFYSAVCGEPVTKEGGPGFVFGLFSHANDSVAGCLVESEGDNEPSKSGPLVYVNVAGRMDQALEAVKAHGGEILQGKHQIGEYGWRAVFVDSEGNRVAMHSMTP